MRDTSPEMEEKYRAMLMARSGEERLKMGNSMYATARALVIASILERDASISPAALRQAVFMRFYGHEFDAATRERILTWLAEPQSADDAERQPREKRVPVIGGGILGLVRRGGRFPENRVRPGTPRTCTG